MVDNLGVTPVRSNSIPLPCAVLALSVAVCIGSAGMAGATPLQAERSAQAQQRQAIESLLDAIHHAARKLTDRLAGQAAQLHRGAPRPTFALLATDLPWADETTPAVLALRDELLNLPPPAC